MEGIGQPGQRLLTSTEKVWEFGRDDKCSLL